MLPDHYFHPLDLGRAIDEAFGDDDDALAVRGIVLEALLDPRARGDERVFDYAWESLEFYDDDQASAVVAMLTRLIEVHPADRFALGALRASWCDDGGETAALRELTSLHGELAALPAEQRDLRFYRVAPNSFAGFGDEEFGCALAAEGVALATRLGRDSDAAEIMMHSPAEEHKRISYERMAAQLEPLLAHAAAPSRLSATPQGKRAQPSEISVYRMAYLSAPTYAQAMTEGLLDASFPVDHEDYRRELQSALCETSERGKMRVVPVDLAGLYEYAERSGADPARRSTRLAYLSTMETDDDIAWPPERNAPCWCGVGRKYKKCCGRPGFDQAPVPDRARVTLRVELAQANPLVWRTVAVPSRIRLDELHTVLHDAMGWSGDHLYAFEVEGGQVLDSRCDDDDVDQAQQTQLPAIASEPGQSFVYRYDLGDDWEHRVTIEAIDEVDPAANQARVLDGAGACPPEDCGGVHHYQELLTALADPEHPRHDDAVEWLGDDWNPGRMGTTRAHAAGLLKPQRIGTGRPRSPAG